MVLLVIIGVGAWLGSRVLTVKNELEAAQATLGSVQAGAGDTESAVRTIAAHAEAAVAATEDPIWGTFEGVYYVGDNLRGVRLAAESLALLTADFAVPAFDSFASDSKTPILQQLIPLFQETSPRVNELSASIAQVQTSTNLVSQVRSGVDQVASVLTVVSPTLEIIPKLLGADGAQNYLMAAMNNAEVSNLGGSAASQTLIRADNGKLAIKKQADSGDYSTEPLNVDVGISPEMTEILGDVMYRRINAVMSRPDFPTAATLLKAFWERDINSKQKIHGVVALDPLALAQILQATGPIKLSDGSKVTSENVVRKLLNEVYLKMDDPNQGDAYFKEVALAVFSKVSTGDFDPRTMITAIQNSINSGSILFWSADAQIEEMIQGTRAAGILPTTNEPKTTLGVYFRDGSEGSKIDYYMLSEVKTTATCSAKGKTDFKVKVKLDLDLSQGAADQLPDYVKSGKWGSEKFLTEIFIYGPPGTKAGKVVLNDGDVGRKPRKDLGRPVVKTTVPLKPGENRTIEVHFTGTEASYGELTVESTPMIHATELQLDDQSCG